MDGVTNNNGIKAAGADGKTSQNPYYYFTADVKITSTDSEINLDDTGNPIWKSVKLLMRSTNTGSERRSEAATINDLNSDYITGTMSNFHVEIPLTAIPNRTGNNAAVSIDWNDVQEMKFDVEVSDWAVDDGTYTTLSMELTNAEIITTDPSQKWDYTEPDLTPEPPPEVNYTRDQLLEELAEEIDPGKYTEASYNTYAGVAANAKTIADDDNAAQKNINRAYLAVLGAKRMLAENPQDNWVATFSKISGDFSILNPTSTQLYADRKQADQGSLDATDRSNLRLQLRVITQYKGEDANLQDMLGRLTIKLRSTDKSNVEGDPESGNKEHNYGWDLQETDFGDGAELLLSIPLDKESTNHKGVIDWTDIGRIIIIGVLHGDYAKDGANCIMKLSDVRIVDMKPISAEKSKLQELASETINTDGCEESLVTAYNAAKTKAEAVVLSTDEFLSLYDINKAYTELQEAIKAIESGESGQLTFSADAQYDGGNTVIYSFNASAQELVRGTVIAAVYDSDDRLIGIDIKENIASDNQTGTGVVNVTGTAAKCSVFFWKSLSDLMPLADGITKTF